MDSQRTDTERDHQVSGDQEVERHWIQKMKDDTIFGNIQNFIHEFYLHLTSTDFISQSFAYAKKNLTESPCSTLLYVFLALFGFLPIICFVLFVCGTFILWLVCFIFCQAIAVTLAGAVCGVLFLFIIATCCLMATAFGLTVHTLSFMGQVYRVLAFNAPEAMVFLRQQLGKLGIHLRLPGDDQQ